VEVTLISPEVGSTSFELITAATEESFRRCSETPSRPAEPQARHANPFFRHPVCDSCSWLTEPGGLTLHLSMRRQRCHAVRHALLQSRSLVTLYLEHCISMIWKCRCGTTRTIGNMRLIHEWHHTGTVSPHALVALEAGEWIGVLPPA